MFVFLFFGHAACGILVPQPGIEPVQGKHGVLTPGPLGKSWDYVFKKEKGDLQRYHKTFLLFKNIVTKYTSTKQTNKKHIVTILLSRSFHIS